MHYPSEHPTTARGLVDVRGLIHAHSIHSHDACDSKPKDEATGQFDAVCLEDFRRGLCQAGHDFVMLSDHNTFFHELEYPEVLLYQPEHGDSLVERDGSPVASWAGCKGVAGDDRGAAEHRTLIMAGTESETMPVGLERHVPGTIDERHTLYNEISKAALDAFHAAFAVNLAQHTENWTPEQLADLPFDGFEMYNVHANLMTNLAPAVALIGQIANNPSQLPQSDLVLLPVIQEDARYLATWGTVLARGNQRVTTMGSDCHRNSFETPLPDGERIDSYRRMMVWFSNHLLVKPGASGEWDDRSLKDALRAGRLYGAFEVLGYPVGFDYRVESGGAPGEMGSNVNVTEAPELVVVRPSVKELSKAVEPPLLTLRILRAKEGGWDEVARGDGADLHYKPTEPGAYRAEVRMTPRHLAGWLSSYVELAKSGDFVWIYSNAIYIKG